MDLAAAVAGLLGLDPAGIALSDIQGGDSSARTAMVKAQDSRYFVKHAAGDEARVMLLGLTGAHEQNERRLRTHLQANTSRSMPSTASIPPSVPAAMDAATSNRPAFWSPNSYP
jgi:hypothetical protein